MEGSKANNHRSVAFRSFATGDTGPRLTGAERVSGRQDDVDERVRLLEVLGERTGYSYVIDETGVPGISEGGRTLSPALRRPRRTRMDKSVPDPPEAVERIRVTVSLFEAAGTANIHTSGVVKTLHALGLFSCADVLAVGSGALEEWSHAASSNLGGVLGMKRLRAVATTLRRTTGHTLQADRATPAAQHLYYEDIGRGSPSLALPTARFDRYAALELRRNYPIGLLMAAPPGELAKYSRLLNTQLMVNFVLDELTERVVKPFNQAEAE